MRGLSSRGGSKLNVHVVLCGEPLRRETGMHGSERGLGRRLRLRGEVPRPGPTLRVIARSEEVKAKGIPMGAPLFKWENELEEIGAEVLSSNYALYVSRARVSSENVLYKQKEHGSLRRLDGPTGLSCVA